MKKTTVYFLCAGIFLYSGLSGQSTIPGKRDSAKSPSDSIKTVTVTATRTEKDVMDVGRSVTVISGDQLKQPGCNSVADLLSQQEGIYIVGTGQNPGSVQYMYLRGGDANHTTIMIDGVPISDPSSPTGALDLSELSLNDVASIEITRGSHSTLYGSSAMGGVINIITNNNYSPGLHGSISATGGEFGPNTNMFDGSALLNYTFKNGIYLEGGYHRFDDKAPSAAVDTLQNPLKYQQNPQNDLDKGDVFSRIGYKDQALNAYFEYRNTNQTSGLADGPFEPANNYTGQLVRDFYTGFIKYAITPQFHIQYTGSYSPMERKYVQDTSATSDTGKFYQRQYYASKTITNDVQLEYDYKTSQFIAGGGSYYESINSNTNYFSETDYPSMGYDYLYTSETNLDTIKPHQTIYNAFAQADLNGATFAPGLKAFSLLLGARYSANSMFGNNVSYEINPSVKVNPNTLLYLSYSTGFNAPSLYELYGPDDIAGDPVSLANPTLKAETSNSIEFGLKHKIDNVYFTLSYFSTIVNNYIDYVYLWTKNKPVDSLQYTDFVGDTYLNVGQETTQGIELDVASQLDKTLFVSANMSILSSSLTYSNSSIGTSHTHGSTIQLFNGGNFLTPSSGNVKYIGLLRRPGAMANITLTYSPIPKLHLSIAVRYVGQRTDAQYNGAAGPFGADQPVSLADYTLLGASAGYDVFKNFSVMVKGDNLLNTTYYEILGYTTMGRSLFLNIRYSF